MEDNLGGSEFQIPKNGLQKMSALLINWFPKSPQSILKGFPMDIKTVSKFLTMSKGFLKETPDSFH